jgi:tryptophan 6-halogenase
MNNIIIVGGGTAGLVTALILKKRLDVRIKIIIPNNIGIIGVGEGSTEHFDEFRKHLNISQEEVLKKTFGTLKSGIMFEGWSDKHPTYLHHINSLWNFKLGLSTRNYEYLMINNKTSKDFVPEIYFNNQIDLDLKATGNLVQFHFNTFKLNEYLITLCKQNKIEIVNDEIKNVEVDVNGISNLIGKNKIYKANFYIDSTGFKKVLISKLGAKWKSYSNYLKTNAAIAFPTEDQKEYNVWTLSKAMKYGWMWQIPTYGRTGNGYVFNKDYINKDQAVEEVETLLKRKIEVAKYIEYDPGALEKVWIKNCVAVGLSANFVEPLEASSIGTSIQQAFLLMQYLENYNEQSIKIYNNQVSTIMNNIKDFIQLHYINNKKDTDFWIDVNNTNPSDRLKEYLLIWKSGRLLKATDMENVGDYGLFNLFKEDNFNLIAYFNGLINTKLLKKTYNLINKNLSKYWFENHIKNGIVLRNNTDMLGKISHKKYIQNINDNN